MAAGINLNSTQMANTIFLSFSTPKHLHMGSNLLSQEHCSQNSYSGYSAILPVCFAWPPKVHKWLLVKI